MHIVVQISRTFSSWMTESLYPLNNNSLFSLPPAPSNYHSTFCFYKFDYLGTSCKWNHAVCVHLWLVYFTQHNVLWAHPCCSIWRDFLFLLRMNNIPFHHIFILHYIYYIFFTHSSINVTLFPPFGYFDKISTFKNLTF